ncbi:threonine--tRNA ligase, partial [Planctomycetota bacterium]
MVHQARSFDFDRFPILKKLLQYELSGSRISKEAPPHIRLMQQHELVDYEPGSDQGNFRWYPKGFLLRKLLEEQVDRAMERYGAMQVATPLFYRVSHPALAKYLRRFPARQYRLQADQAEYFLRFA